MRVWGSLFLGLSFVLVSCQKQQNQVTGRAFLLGEDGATHEVEYLAQDGLAIFEGDIEIGSLEEIQTAKGAVANRLGFQYWSHKTVPYLIDPKLPNPQRVLDAIKEWHAKTPIRLVPRTNQFSYVLFSPDKGPGCSSQLGRRGGAQKIRLSGGCSAGAVIHEIGHAVGLWHEQSRSDRDKHITIHWENIEKGASSQFSKNFILARDIGEYDFDSIMHYDGHAFSANGKPTITRNDGGKTLGQRQGLSPKDVAAVKYLYR